MLKITLKKSTVGRLKKHIATVQALGLHRISQSVVHRDTPQIQGMIARVAYMVDVEQVPDEE
ncbi:MAG: 50S ribosomal protein L30 [Deltaproteobacteria bacterium]|nr:MAG: 50S ribosomal protein L30 [Deltaproteobacteria bacterium]